MSQSPKLHQRRRRAWTLIETLVVIAISAILLALAATVLTRVRERANQLTCQSNLRNLVLAVHSHHTAKGRMPPYASGRGDEILGSWFVHLMPYLGHEVMYDLLAT